MVLLTDLKAKMKAILLQVDSSIRLQCRSSISSQAGNNEPTEVIERVLVIAREVIHYGRTLLRKKEP